MLSGETIVSRLQVLLAANEIHQVAVYRHSDGKLFNCSNRWSFGHEYMQVGDESYNLGRIITFSVVDQRLCLYF